MNQENPTCLHLQSFNRFKSCGLKSFGIPSCNLALHNLISFSLRPMDDNPNYMDPDDTEPSPSPTMAQATPVIQENVSLINTEDLKDEKKESPNFYRIGVAALGGFLAGNVVPRLGKPLIYFSVSSMVSVPFLIYMNVLNVTDEGKETIEEVSKNINEVKYEKYKDMV